jgi:general secretion pathway protein K
MSSRRPAAECGRGGGRRRSRSRRAPRAQRGIALLVAILLVALGTIIAAAVAYENAMTVRRGIATFAFDESVLIGQGAEALAAYGLRQFWQGDQKNHVFYTNQGWDKPIGPIEVVPGVMLVASLEDLQGRFNLNNLVNSDGKANALQLAAFTKLLETLGLETKWAGYLVDWIDADNVPSIPDGAEDSVYTGQTPPYRQPNRYITSITELLALPGFDRDRYLKLAPYVTALPRAQLTPINVCTAPPAVLDAFLPPGRSEFGSDPEALARHRANSLACSPTLDDYQAAFDQKVWNGSNGQPGASQAFRMTSNYFRLTSVVTIGSAEFNLYSLLYLDPGGGGPAGPGAVRAIQRSFTPD